MTRPRQLLALVPLLAAAACHKQATPAPPPAVAHFGSPFAVRFVAAGEGTVLALAQESDPGSPSRLLVSHDEGASFTRVHDAPERIVDIDADATRWVALTADAVYQSDAGRAWTRTALPPPPKGSDSLYYTDIALVGPAVWVAGGDRVFVRDGGAFTGRVELPPDKNPAPGVVHTMTVSRIVPAGDQALIIADPIGIFRADPAHLDRPLEEWMQGLPPGKSGTVTRVGDTFLLYSGGVYARRAADPKWLALESQKPGRGWPGKVAYLADLGSANAVLAPWAKDVLVFTDSEAVTALGPKQPATPLWVPPKNATYGAILNDLVCLKDVVLVPFAHATRDHAGLAVHGVAGPVTEIRLPVD